MFDDAYTPLKGAAIRFARTFFYGAASAATLSAIVALSSFDGTAAALLIVPATAGLTAVDKFIRERAKKDGVDLGGVYGA